MFAEAWPGPVARDSGEQNIGLMEFERLIDEAGVDMIQPNAAPTGGITD
ncbi:hypothetical protein [Lutibaculum baratangense]|uniref:Uncharacterized protein n=1 Tax=Lutibaculum baratangense AMV1 TaxID=631454 RepID=V4RMV5_9HYPH|nr:hypothetical protein [Lutibaculum baratangense]ESR26619.1 hypothetical protein N177_0838 [Lutibaculum baratangense AMV1]